MRRGCFRVAKATGRLTGGEVRSRERMCSVIERRYGQTCGHRPDHYACNHGDDFGCDSAMRDTPSVMPNTMMSDMTMRNVAENVMSDTSGNCCRMPVNVPTVHHHLILI
jgi:hypothetical protein